MDASVRRCIRTSAVSLAMGPGFRRDDGDYDRSHFVLDSDPLLR
jgi:hypothetical protein